MAWSGGCGRLASKMYGGKLTRISESFEYMVAWAAGLSAAGEIPGRLASAARRTPWEMSEGEGVGGRWTGVAVAAAWGHDAEVLGRGRNDG